MGLTFLVLDCRDPYIFFSMISAYYYRVRSALSDKVGFIKKDLVEFE